MPDKDAVEFMRETIYGWVGNLMRDLDAQNIELTTDDVATALEQVAYEVSDVPEKEDYDDFLRDLDDGRGSE